MIQDSDFQQMIDFVRNYIETHDPIASGLTTRFPFRRRFEHCLRCSVWARRITEAENADVEIAVISSLFHDIGKPVDSTLDHGEVGAEIRNDYLTSTGYDSDRRDHIVRIVREHSSHAREKDASPEAKVVSDADFLDEIGALTVLWDAMASAGEDNPSYEKARDRIAKYYEKLKAGTADYLHTQTARRILEGRLQFLDTFLKNLEYELGNTKDIR